MRFVLVDSATAVSAVIRHPLWVMTGGREAWIVEELRVVLVAVEGCDAR
jgi:hypothetical protein